FKDRHDRDYCLGPTHEEVITDLVRGEVRSYRQLPLILYQIQTKFRDEVRPRFGLMRGREFLMKDAYSFDVSLEAADKSYLAMYEAYKRVFERCGLKAYPVEADTGDIGGKFSHEFHVLADSGEDGIAFCDACGYAANLEKAERRAQAREDAPCGPVECIPTPGAKTIEEVSKFMGLPGSAFVKSLVYLADGRPVMVCVAGDRDVNEVKLKHFLDAKKVELAGNDAVFAATGANAGSVGPVSPADPSLKIVADIALEGAKGCIVGANKDGHHLKNVDLARDAKISAYADLAVAVDGDICAKCGKRLAIRRGIEVGHVFKLGTKYTDAFKATCKRADLTDVTMVMGCYGIGISRTMQAVIEQSHDKDGIIWPAAVAPYQVVIDLLDPADAGAAKVAGDLEAELEKSGIDVIVDDREERLGVKFKDADLIGFPVRVVVGAKGLKSGIVEIKRRDQDKSGTVCVPPEAAAETVRKALS
ncbi:MAG: proline--tRNA ligase, partial [Kiritimatiellae bacterium]|nr:proline--tRNA ligase [Kiritimatiellia bacterium]